MDRADKPLPSGFCSSVPINCCVFYGGHLVGRASALPVNGPYIPVSYPCFVSASFVNQRTAEKSIVRGVRMTYASKPNQTGKSTSPTQDSSPSSLTSPGNNYPDRHLTV